MTERPQKFTLPPPDYHTSQRTADAMAGMSLAEVLYASLYATYCNMTGNQTGVDLLFKLREPQLLQGIANTIYLLQLAGHVEKK